MGFKMAGVAQIVSESDKDFIKNNSYLMSDEEIAKELNLFKFTVYKTRRSLGINKKTASIDNFYSQDKIDFVNHNWLEMNDIEIGKAIGHTKGEIKTLRLTLGLDKNKEKLNRFKIGDMIGEWEVVSELYFSPTRSEPTKRERVIDCKCKCGKVFTHRASTIRSQSLTKCIDCVYMDKSLDRYVDKDNKYCTKCSTVKNINEFHTKTGAPDGLSTVCTDCTKINVIKNEYGISKEELIAMKDRCSNKCEICCKDLSIKEINIDHDHKTEKVRGILCRHCNCALGFFYDNIENLENAIKYLKNSQIC